MQVAKQKHNELVDAALHTKLIKNQQTDAKAEAHKRRQQEQFSQILQEGAKKQMEIDKTLELSQANLQMRIQSQAERNSQVDQAH